MTEAGTRQVVLTAARRLFAERGFRSVTIRDVAAEAGLSPAMVMKVVGSKEQLFLDAASFDPEPWPEDLPLADLGRELVRRVLRRREELASEPWVRAIVLVLPAPNREEVKTRFVRAYVAPLAEALGGGPEAQTRAELVACALVGLAGGTRVYGFAPDDRAESAPGLELYAGLVQSLLEAPLPVR
ncbi:TetR/AcrR family transcriptional regulator [Oryzihumus leptocrescens]|uniref:TetR family transcriptional regulator n=1 Tax=Oryzihumus leptocrescens TaxID=297536 RepID=A0A542ZIW6_9MICO|nr:TetR/AcrR family transcriptional regulator [Oryzihumus leptocrescens]TQL60292.1 TetR family transcriptional regulator [Oryzihumus leptocrescens]